MKEIVKQKRTGDNDKVFIQNMNTLSASSSMQSLAKITKPTPPTEIKASKYNTIGEYKVKDYKERPHEYTDK